MFYAIRKRSTSEWYTPIEGWAVSGCFGNVGVEPRVYASFAAARRGMIAIRSKTARSLYDFEWRWDEIKDDLEVVQVELVVTDGAPIGDAVEWKYWMD